LTDEVRESTSIEIVTPRSGLSLRGLYEVFSGPSELFEELKSNPRVLIAFFVIIAVSLAFFTSIVDYIIEFQLSMPEAQERLQGIEMTPQIRRIMEYQTIGGGTIILVLVPILVPIIAAALAMFWGNFVFAGQARFKQLLSVMCYGEIIIAAGKLIVLPMMLAKESFIVSLSPAVLAVSQGANSLAYVALSKLDLFIIWEIIVIGIGLSIVYNVPRNKGYLLSVLSMGMLSILHVLLTAAFKMM